MQIKQKINICVFTKYILYIPKYEFKNLSSQVELKFLNNKIA